MSNQLMEAGFGNVLSFVGAQTSTAPLVKNIHDQKLLNSGVGAAQIAT